MLSRRLRNFTKSAARRFTTTKEEKVKIGKYDINYLKIGNGAHNVILTPGALGTIWSNYNLQINGFDKEKFTLVIFDPPGYGKSYPREREFSRQIYEKDADTAFELMKFLGIPKYSSMGWSAGGSASLILAAKYPDAIKKLVVWGANPSFLREELDAYKAIKDINTWTPSLRSTMINEYGEENLAKYWSKWVDSMYAVFESNTDICSGLLKDIKCPTLIIHGLKDPLMNNAHLMTLHEQIKNSTTHVYPEGKHSIHKTYTEDFNNRVQEFLLRPE